LTVRISGTVTARRGAEKRIIQEQGLAKRRGSGRRRRRYHFRYGDFQKVHRCAVLAAEWRAHDYEYADIEVAFAYLRGLLDALMPVGSASRETGRVPSI
jgi:hypothetical protein